MDNNENSKEGQRAIKETLSPEEKKEYKNELEQEIEGKIELKGHVKPRQDKQNRRKDPCP